MVNIYFGVGSKAGITPRDLARAITNEGGLGGEQIGEVQVKANFAGRRAGECGAASHEDEVQFARPQGEDPPRTFPETFGLEDLEGALDPLDPASEPV